MTNGGDGTEDLLRSVLNTLIQRIRVLRTQAPSLVPSVRDRVRADAQRFLPNGQGVVDGLDCTLDGAGLRLKRLRRRRGIMPADLAAETGVSASTLSRLEAGLWCPTLEQFLPLARAYGVALHDDQCRPGRFPEPYRQARRTCSPARGVQVP